MPAATVTFPTPAGHSLTGTLYTPQHPVTRAVLIAPATGIKRRFYARFAEYLEQQEYGTLVFDYQGIGDSLAGKLSDCPASLVSWGVIDMSAALNELMRHFPNATYQLIGHSAGAQLPGLMHNADKLSSLLAVAGSSGSLRNMPMPFYVQAQVFMRVIIPLSNAVQGVSRTDLVGMGGPLPRQAGAQWSRWCLGQGYVETGFGHEVNKHVYDSLNIPSLWVNAVDDDIAVNRNVDDMIRVFKKMALHAQKRTLEPSEFGLKSIGHMGFFKHNELWPLALDWLEKHG